MRLDRFLSDMNVASRSELRKAIRNRQVTVNGETIRDPGFLLSPEEQPEVICRGKRVEYQELQYFMLNKPAGVISASEDRKQKTVVDLIGEEKRRDLFPVGRLDRDTEGLLLLTNDGQLAHRLLSPKKQVDKQYFARISGKATAEDSARFAAGIRYDTELTARPARLEILTAGEESSEILVTIQEGKFHQIKKMVAALGGGKQVLYLKRLSIGALRRVESLRQGEYGRLRQEELGVLCEKGKRWNIRNG